MRLIITFDNLRPELVQGIIAAVRDFPGCGDPVIQLETNDAESIADLADLATDINAGLLKTPHHETS